MDILDIFGLQIVLEDKTSENARRAENSLQKLGVTVQNVEKQIYGSFQRMESVMHSGFQIQRWGTMITTAGVALGGTMTMLGKKALETGSAFETQRIKLKTLYKDAQKAEEVFQYAVKGALATPFSVEEYVGAVAGLKVSGIDPLKQYRDETTGQYKDLITLAGDLAGAFGKNMKDSFFSLKEAIAGGDFRSLRARFDGLSKSTIESVTGMTLAVGGGQKAIEQRAEVFAKFISMKYSGMAVALGQTMKGILSRMKENVSVFFMQVADAGFYDVVKKDLNAIITYVEGNQDKVKQFAKTVSDALITMWRPISYGLKLLTKLVDKFVDFSNQHPKIAKFIALATMLSGTFLVLSGVLVTFGGVLVTMIASLATLALNMRLTHSSASLSSMIFQGFGKIMLSTAFALGKLTLASFVLYSAWKYNIGGIRTGTIDFVNGIKESYAEFKKLLGLDIGTFSASVNGGFVMLGKNASKLDGLSKALTTAYYIGKGFFDYMKDGTISEDTVRRLDILGGLGWLEKLIYFETAFRSTIKGIADYLIGVWNTFKPVLTWVYDKLTKIVDLYMKLMGHSEFNMGDGLAPNGKQLLPAWEKFGNVIGFLIASAITMRVGKAITGQVAKVLRINRMLKNAVAVTTGTPINDAGQMLRRFPLERDGTKFKKAPTSKYKPVTWKNLAMNSIGKQYYKVEYALGKLNDTRLRTWEKLTQHKQKGLDIQKKLNTETKKGFALGRRAHTRSIGKRVLTSPMSFFQMEFIQNIKSMKDLIKKQIAGEQLGWGRRGKAPSEAQRWKQFESTNKIFAKTVTTFGSILKAVRDPKTFAQNMRTTIREKVTTVRDGAVNTAKGGAKGVNDFFAGIIGGLASSSMGQKLFKAMSPSFKWLGTALGVVMRHPLVATVVGLGAILFGVVNDWKLAEKIYQSFVDGLEWAVAGILAGVYHLAEAVNGVLEPFFQGIALWFDDVAKGWGKMVDDLWWAITIFGMDLQDAFFDFVDIIVQFGHDLVTNPTEAFSRLSANIDAWMDDVDASWDTFWTNVGGAIAEFVDGAWNSALDRMGDAFEGAIGRMLAPWTSFVEDVKEKLAFLGVDLDKFMGKVGHAKNDLSTFNYSKPLAYANPNVTINGNYNQKKKPSSGESFNKNHGKASKLFGMSTGGTVRSAGMFELHQGERVINDPTMNLVEAGIKKINSMSNKTTSNESNSTSTTGGDIQTGDLNFNFHFPNITDGDPQSIVDAIKNDPSVQQAFLQFLRSQEVKGAMNKGKQIRPNWGYN